MINLQAQLVGNPPGVTYQRIDNLCYTTTTTERIIVSEELDTTTLTNMDKIKFISKDYKQNHHEYFNSNLYSTFDISYIYHKNLFAKWYIVSDLIRQDNHGITNFYSSYNKYFTGGWPGGMNHPNIYGTYYTDPRSGNKYCVQNYSGEGQLAYDAGNQNFRQYGFLYGKVFYYPNAELVRYLISMGYSVTSSINTVIASNSEVIITWNSLEKTIKAEFLQGSTTNYIVTTKYKYNSTLEVDIRTEVIEIIPDFFENGDCYDQIIVTKYKDYQTTCGPDLQYRISENQLELNKEIELSPNPVDDNLKIKLTDNKNLGRIEILNITGKVVLRQTLDPHENYFIEINVSSLEEGMYFINLAQGNLMYVQKFIKL